MDDAGEYLRERRAALRAELARALDPRQAFRADGGPDGAGAARRGTALRACTALSAGAALRASAALRLTRRGLGRLSDRLPHRLAHRDAGADPRASAGGAIARRRDRNGLRDLILRVARQVADDAHADTLVEPLLKLLGQRDVLDLETLQRQPELGEDGT